MIPCFPANSNTHITEDSLPNISQIRTRSTTKQLNHCLENQQGYSLKYTNTGKRSCRVITESSQEDYTDEHPFSIVSNRPSTYRTRSVTERLNQQDDYTDEHPYDIAPNRSSAFHITEDSPPNTSQSRTRSTTKQLNHCLENQKGYYLRNTNTRERSCRVITDSSQEDYTDEHPCGIVPNRSSTLHTTEDSPSNTSQIRTRSTTKQLNHCLENRKGGYYLRNGNKTERSCRVITDSSQDD